MKNNLQIAIEQQHECKATFREMAFVREQFQGKTVWEGDVSVFDITGHPAATVAYAWADPIPGTNRTRFFAVLHLGPVGSPSDAVKAAIASRFQEEIAKS